MLPSLLARTATLVLVGLCACSLELPGASSGDANDLDLDASALDAAPERDAAFYLDAEPPDASLEDPLDGANTEDASELDARSDGELLVRCGEAEAGAIEARTRYAATEVVAPESCEAETQQRTCEAGGWSSWSGTFESEQCVVVTNLSCGAVPHGAEDVRTRFVALLANSASGCLSEQQRRTCSDGTFGPWTGTYHFPACVVRSQGECALDSLVPCQPGTSCVANAAATGWSCLGATGFPCSANGQCVGTCVDGRCAATAPPGGACDDEADCEGCSEGGSVACVENMCRCSDGSTCSDNDQCKGTCLVDQCAPVDAACDDHDDCEGERACLRKAGLLMCVLPPGSDCETNSECQQVCRDEECAAVGRSDEDCDENADCAGALVCRSEACAQLGALTQPCDENADCAQGLACGTLLGSRVCLRALGQPCTLAIECASGRCASSADLSLTCQ